VNIAVNGTLMRGLELEPNLVNLGAVFVHESFTERKYRLFSIDDAHPGMIRVPVSGLEKDLPVSVAVEIWCVRADRLATLLTNEPPGLSIGKIMLNDGKTEVLGVLAEPALIVGKKDISDYPGGGVANFRHYIIQEGMRMIDQVLADEPKLNEVETIRAFRTAAETQVQDGNLRGAIELLTFAIRKLGLKNRLFQNIPVLPISSIEHVLDILSRSRVT